MSFDSNALTINRPGLKGEKFLASWRHPRADSFAELWQAANDARGYAQDFFMHAESINSDIHLSDEGRKSKLTERGKESLRLIGQAQKLLNEAVGEIQSERAKLTATERKTGTDGLAQTILDVEFARMLREFDQNQRDTMARQLMAGEHPQIIEAVIRLPGMATGLTENMRQMIERAEVERRYPNELMKMNELDAAVVTAQRVIRESANVLLQEAPAMDLSEQIEALEGEWRGVIRGNNGAMDAIARRVVTVEPM